MVYYEFEGHWFLIIAGLFVILKVTGIFRTYWNVVLIPVFAALYPYAPKMSWRAAISAVLAVLKFAGILPIGWLTIAGVIVLPPVCMYLFVLSFYVAHNIQCIIRLLINGDGVSS